MLSQQHIVLIGMPGVGKSAVGALLARALGRPFYDTDSLIEKSLDKTISEIFSQHGEDCFRQEEAAMITTLLARKPAVIVVGAGGLQNLATRKQLQAHYLVHLEASEEALSGRLQCDTTRPLLNIENKQKTLQELYASRAPIYQQMAKKTVNTENKSLQKIVIEIQSSLEPCTELTL
jgi:shikimate kinase